MSTLQEEVEEINMRGAYALRLLRSEGPGGMVFQSVFEVS